MIPELSAHATWSMDVSLAAAGVAQSLPIGHRAWICLRCPFTAEHARSFTERSVFLEHLRTEHQLDRAALRPSSVMSTALLDGPGYAGAMRTVAFPDGTPLVAVIQTYATARRTKRRRSKVTR